MSRENPKPFKTIDEQVEILRSRGLGISDQNRAAAFLLRENYYAVVNGYKDAFLDLEASNLAGEDRYRDGSTFDALSRVFIFDKELRDVTMAILLEAEAAMRTATVYAFCSVHGGPDDYLNPACYCSKSDYRPEWRYTKGLIRLLSTLQGVRDNRPHKAYIAHYDKNYHVVPLWVASKCLTFGIMSAFFDFQEQSVKTRTCVALARALGCPVVKQRALEYAYHTLPEFRNVCAHGERLYCARAGKNIDKGFGELLRAMSTVVPAERLSSYACEVLALLREVGAADAGLEESLLRGMRLTEHDFETMIL